MGRAHVRGADQQFSFLSGDNLRFKNSVTGKLPDISAYDGTVCWASGVSGYPHPIVQQDRDLSLITAWVLDGDLSKAPTVMLKPIDKNTITVSLSDARLAATLSLDSTTHQPHTLSYTTPAGAEVWTFTKYKEFEGRTFPTHISHSTGADLEWFDIQTAKPTVVHDSDFALPEVNQDPAKYDAGPFRMPSRLIDRLTTRFVHPKVDGQDIGWFFLDTGAEAMCIDPVAAKQLNMTAVGTTITAGVVATLQTPIERSKSFQLGPVILEAPTYLELDLSQFAKIFRLKVVGICGFDFLCRASISLDTKVPSMSVYKPGEVPLPAGATWNHIDFAGELICMSCKFEGDNEGLFTLDTGSGSTVDFMSPTVEKLDMLKNRKTTTVNIGGAGGSASSLSGKLAWFEIGGNRINDLNALFGQGKTGAYGSPYFCGNVGAGILGRFNFILDYKNQRVSFVSKTAGAK